MSAINVTLLVGSLWFSMYRKYLQDRAGGYCAITDRHLDSTGQPKYRPN